MNRLDAIAFDLKESLEDLVNEIKIIQKSVEELKTRVNEVERGNSNGTSSNNSK